MTLYATTAIPSYDLVSGIHTLQRLSGPVIHLSHIGWNEKDHLCVAILKTDTSNFDLASQLFNELSECLSKFNVELNKALFLSTAVERANKIAQVVEFEDNRQEILNDL